MGLIIPLVGRNGWRTITKARGWAPDIRTTGCRTQKRGHGNIVSTSQERALLWQVGLHWVSGDLGSAIRTGRTLNKICLLPWPQFPL